MKLTLLTAIPALIFTLLLALLAFDIWHHVNDRKWKRGAEGVITQHAEHINRSSSNNAVVLYFLNGGTNMAGKTVAWEYLTFVKGSNVVVTNEPSNPQLTVTTNASVYIGVSTNK